MLMTLFYIIGFLHQTTAELSFDEQAELNQAIVSKIQNKLPTYTAELEHLKKSIGSQKKSSRDQVKELRESLDQKLNTLQEQENEKVELMMEWLNHRINDFSGFNDNSSELLNLKTKILDLKSKYVPCYFYFKMFR